MLFCNKFNVNVTTGLRSSGGLLEKLFCPLLTTTHDIDELK